MSNILFLKHFLSTKGPLHVFERMFEVTWRFSRGGHRFDQTIELIRSIVMPHGIRITFFVVAGIIKRHSRRIKRLQEMGHDISSHGMYHSRLDLFDYKSQLQILEVSHQTLKNEGFEVSGFRCPYLNHNDNTLKALANSSYRWSSNEFIIWDNILGTNTDTERLDSLYHCHRWQDRLLLPHLSNQRVNIPLTSPDDEILYERYRIRRPLDICNIWKSVFNQIYSSGELFHLLVHPERILIIQKAIDNFLDHVCTQYMNIWFPTLNELAQWWEKRMEWSWEYAGNGQVRIKAPLQSTILLKDAPYDSSRSESEYIHGSYHVIPLEPTYPAYTIGLSNNSPASLEDILHAEGYLVERVDSQNKHSLFVDRPDFDHSDSRKVLQEIDECPKPLLRLWRWPNSYRSVFCISSDVCAIDLRDFFDRIKHF